MFPPQYQSRVWTDVARTVSGLGSDCSPIQLLDWPRCDFAHTHVHIVTLHSPRLAESSSDGAETTAGSACASATHGASKRPILGNAGLGLDSARQAWAGA